MKQFIIDHFDAIITILITILGFIITYFLNQSSFRDEVKKDKLSRTAEEIKSLPFDICQMMLEIKFSWIILFSTFSTKK